MRWNDLTPVAKTLQALWNVKAIIGKNLDIRFNVREVAGKELMLVWDTRSLFLWWPVDNAVSSWAEQEVDSVYSEIVGITSIWTPIPNQPDTFG